MGQSSSRIHPQPLTTKQPKAHSIREPLNDAAALRPATPHARASATVAPEPETLAHDLISTLKDTLPSIDEEPQPSPSTASLESAQLILEEVTGIDTTSFYQSVEPVEHVGLFHATPHSSHEPIAYEDVQDYTKIHWNNGTTEAGFGEDWLDDDGSFYEPSQFHHGSSNTPQRTSSTVLAMFGFTAQPKAPEPTRRKLNINTPASVFMWWQRRYRAEDQYPAIPEVPEHKSAF